MSVSGKGEQIYGERRGGDLTAAPRLVDCAVGDWDRGEEMVLQVRACTLRLIIIHVTYSKKQDQRCRVFN